VILFFAVAFLSVPVFGLYFSLRCRNFIAAFLATVAVGLLLPLVLSEVLEVMRWAGPTSNSDEFLWVGPPVLGSGDLPGHPRRDLLGPALSPAEAASLSAGEG
jgi:hypothetical protein